MPFNAIMAFWEELYKTGKTTALPTQDKIAALRAVFHERDIVRITDGLYSPHIHKAIRYDLGAAAPGQSPYWQEDGPKGQPTIPLTQQPYLMISRHCVPANLESQPTGSIGLRKAAIPPCRAGP